MKDKKLKDYPPCAVCSGTGHRTTDKICANDNTTAKWECGFCEEQLCDKCKSNHNWCTSKGTKAIKKYLSNNDTQK